MAHSIKARSIISRRTKGPQVLAIVAQNAPTFCTVHTISKGELISVRSATCTENENDNLEDSDEHLNGISGYDQLQLSEMELPVQHYPERLPLQRNDSPSNINKS